MLQLHWRTYLEAFFKPLKHVSKYHRFILDSKQSGVVTCKESASSTIVQKKEIDLAVQENPVKTSGTGRMKGLLN